MNMLEFDALPDGPKPAHAERLMEAARRYRDMEQAAYRSMSGADVAEAPLRGLTADGLACIAEGKDPEATILFLEVKWRVYATENNRKVEAAPRIKRGPSAGHSVISHRWVSPDAFQTVSVFLRSMLTPPPQPDGTP